MKEGKVVGDEDSFINKQTDGPNPGVVRHRTEKKTSADYEKNWRERGHGDSWQVQRQSRGCQ